MQNVASVVAVAFCFFSGHSRSNRLSYRLDLKLVIEKVLSVIY